MSYHLSYAFLNSFRLGVVRNKEEYRLEHLSFEDDIGMQETLLAEFFSVSFVLVKRVVLSVALHLVAIRVVSQLEVLDVFWELKVGLRVHLCAKYLKFNQ